MKAHFLIARSTVGCLMLASWLAGRSHASGVEEFMPEAEKARFVDKAVAGWAGINRWLIEYEAVPASLRLESPLVHRIMAVSAPGELYDLSAHSPSSYPWQVDPLCQEYFIHKGKTCHRWPFSRAYAEGTITPGQNIPGTVSLDILLAIVPRWPLTEYRMPANQASGVPVILVDALRSTNYVLRTKQEVVDGVNCAIFVRGDTEQIWVAADKGLCLMRRDTRDARTKKLVERILTERTGEVAPGLWLPLEYRVRFFKTGEAAVEGALERENKIRIIRCDLNEMVPDSTFEPKHGPGSIRYEDENRFAQVAPGGESLLDDLVNFMLKYAKLPSRSFPQGHPFGWLLAGAIVGAVAGICISPAGKLRGVPEKKAVVADEMRAKQGET